ncbi:MAG: phosphate ABC transporter permease subunit PstC [Kiritimatiellia bacterium]
MTAPSIVSSVQGDSLRPSLLLTHSAQRRQRLAMAIGQGFLLAVTSMSTLAVLFIFYFIARDALPFFRLEGLREFFTSVRWYPSAHEPEYGALAIFVGSGLVTLGAILVAVHLGVTAAICLSDILPFSIRQVVKPLIEILAAIPSVAYGFFALVVLAPLLQERGGPILAVALWIVGAPLAGIATIVIADVSTDRLPDHVREWVRWLCIAAVGVAALIGLTLAGKSLAGLHISSGTNALNVSVILGIMALPTIVSVSEDALQAVGRELREGSYALGATRFETIVKTVLPAAGSGILAAVILGVMRAIGETMVVWMASGNAAQIPAPWYNFLEPVRTLTATIAGDMGEADHVTGSARYHVLFAMALCLLVFSFLCNVSSEWIVRRARRRVRG